MLKRPRPYVSVYGDDVVKNCDPEMVVQFWERKGYDAKRAGDYRLMHEYLQQAENFKPRNLDGHLRKN